MADSYNPELINFVHGALCPYFIAVGYSAYSQCGAGWPKPGWPTGAPSPSKSWAAAPTGNGTWGTWTSTSTAWVKTNTSTTAPVAQYTGAAVARNVAGALAVGGAAAAAFLL
jgi:hypothetical protein